MIFTIFTVLVALCLLVLVYSRLHWVLKIALIATVFTFCFLVWSAQDTTRGWPVARAFPNDAQFISCIVTEPNAEQGIKGAIYLWLIPLEPQGGGVFTYASSLYEPRAYQEPYDESLQAACQTAQKMQAGGQAVRLAQGPKRRGGSGQSGSLLIPGRYHVYHLPPVLPPQKAR